MAIEAETGLEPEELLKVLKKTETAMGRSPGTRWGPRVIDLDILFYDDLVIKTADLEVPHPGIKEREFVVRPLAEIAPEKVHPVLQKSVKMLLEELSG
jgi:2-amino-4-hydroxy-6-hydroxymethyldihydropteridine diphosphokinase